MDRQKEQTYAESFHNRGYLFREELIDMMLKSVLSLRSFAHGFLHLRRGYIVFEKIIV